MNIHCMHCGHTIQLGDAYDAFSGPLRCSVCKGMMTVRIADGQLLAMGPFPPVPFATDAVPTPASAPGPLSTPATSAPTALPEPRGEPA